MGEKLGYGLLLLFILLFITIRIGPVAENDDQALSGLEDISQIEVTDVMSPVQFSVAPVDILSGRQGLNITWRGCPSTNWDSSRLEIKYIVIHWFASGTLESVDRLFQNPKIRRSAHYGISGNTIYQWVAENEVAYHCGVYAINQQSIGIEHDATTSHIASEVTYQTSAALVAELSLRYDIPIDRQHILKHSEVRATDCPGTLDVDRIVKGAKAYSP